MMRLVPVVLALFLSSPLFAQNLRITTSGPDILDPSQPAAWRVTITNISGRELPAAPLFLYMPYGDVRSVSPQFGCALTGADWRCTLPALAVDETVHIDVIVQPRFRYGRVSIGASVSYIPGRPETTLHGKTFWREFPVTSAADVGPGSLRETILAINADRDCNTSFPVTPCKAAFRITDPVPEEGWHTLRLQSPLPALTAWDTGIDGSTQTATNTLGPKVALDGSALAFGDGVTTDGPAPSGRSEIRGLAIGGFPANGILATVRSEVRVEECYIGVDPTGRHANPNGSRGIASHLLRGTIVNNVISGNRRSGIFFLGELSVGPNIRNNRIGVAAHDDTPIGNGASGIYIGDFYGAYNYPTIEGNLIANNHHFGIALSPKAPMLILANTVRDNGGGGIDIGLDGPSESANGVGGVGGVLPVPVILSATYANGITTITGYSTAGDRRQVLLYANSTLDPDGFAEGEQFLGITPLQHRENTAFTFEHHGDLRGKFINGTSFAVTQWGWDEYSYTSSEFGRAVAVLP